MLFVSWSMSLDGLPGEDTAEATVDEGAEEPAGFAVSLAVAFFVVLGTLGASFLAGFAVRVFLTVSGAAAATADNTKHNDDTRRELCEVVGLVDPLAEAGRD